MNKQTELSLLLYDVINSDAPSNETNLLQLLFFMDENVMGLTNAIDQIQSVVTQHWQTNL